MIWYLPLDKYHFRYSMSIYLTFKILVSLIKEYQFIHSTCYYVSGIVLGIEHRLENKIFPHTTQCIFWRLFVSDAPFFSVCKFVARSGKLDDLKSWFILLWGTGTYPLPTFVLNAQLWAWATLPCFLFSCFSKWNEYCGSFVFFLKSYGLSEIQTYIYASLKRMHFTPRTQPWSYKQ